MSVEVNRIEALFDTTELARDAERASSTVATASVDGETDPRGPHYWRCPARPGRNHDISMRRPGGGFACWFCCKSTAQIQAAHDERA